MNLFQRCAFSLLFLLLIVIGAAAEPLSFQHAIELALTHSPLVGEAAADQMKAQQAYMEARNAYLPQVIFGSGIAETYGFPLSIEGSAPSIFSVNYTSYLLNFAQRDFMKAAKREWHGTSLSRDEQRRDVILDAAATYLELDKTAAQIRVLREQQQEAANLVQVVNERMKAGMASDIELTQSKLVGARVRMRVAELEGSADVLRQKMSQLTGLPAQSIETVTESVPKFPEVDQQADLSSVAVGNSGAVKVAQEHADATEIRARATHKLRYPAIDLVAQYGLFSRFNNYDLYFNRFQRNNLTAGVAIRVPFLNYVIDAQAGQVEADALKARKQAEAVKNQVSADTLKLQRQVEQLAAAQQVTSLEYDLARSQAEGVQIRSQAGSGSPAPNAAAAPATPQALANARLQASDRYSSYLDTTYEYEKAQLQLLRATGELEEWALPIRH